MSLYSHYDVGNLMKTKFKETPLMSTYLVAFVVGRMKSVEKIVDGVKVQRSEYGLSVVLATCLRSCRHGSVHAFRARDACKVDQVHGKLHKHSLWDRQDGLSSFIPLT